MVIKMDFIYKINNSLIVNTLK